MPEGFTVTKQTLSNLVMGLGCFCFIVSAFMLYYLFQYARNHRRLMRELKPQKRVPSNNTVLSNDEDRFEFNLKKTGASGPSSRRVTANTNNSRRGTSNLKSQDSMKRKGT